jgi:CheY-like chemotaxis protein
MDIYGGEMKPSERPESEKKTILIVDDNKVSLMMVDTILSEAGYFTIRAANGNDALLLARNEHPDLIILDIAMPGLDGIDVALVLKNDQQTRKIPIIFLSCLVGREIRAGKDLCLDSTFLSKPVEKEILLKEIAQHL